MKTRIPRIGLAAVAAALLAGGCGDDKHAGHDEHDEHAGEHDEHEQGGPIELSPEAAAHAGITVQKVELRTLAAEIATTGEVGFDETRLAHVSPRISGRVHKVNALLGDRVKKGQTLAVIDSVELGQAKAEYIKAKARLEVAQRTYEREKRLADKQISSEQDMLDAEAAYRDARVAHDTAAQTLRLYGLSDKAISAIAYDSSGTALVPLVAPLDGKVVDMHATVGELISPETKVYSVADLGRLWIWIDVYERDLSRVHVGDTAYVRADAFPDQVFEGTVSYLQDQVDRDTRTVRARIDVDNPSGTLRPGMFARVRLADPHAADGVAASAPVIVVPAAAVQRDGDEQIVFVQIAERTYERREVTLGRASGDVVEVVDGLRPEESVAVTGGFLLKSEARKGTMGGGHSH